MDPRLSLGVELEFFLVFRPGLFGNAEHSPVEQAMIAVGNAIHHFRVPVADVKVNLECATERSYKTWSVDTDDHELTSSEIASLPEGFVAAPIEVISRAFRYKTQSFREEIQCVLSAVRSLEGPECATITTEATGLHVHLGLGVRQKSTTPWCLPAVRNMLTFLLACEPALDRLHTTKRIGHDQTSFCCPLSFFFAQSQRRSGLNSQRHGRMKLWIRDIERVDSPEGLMGLFTSHSAANQTGRLTEEYNHNSAYNLENLEFRKISSSTGKNTMEFRQHAGTLDPSAVLAWIELLAAIVSWFTCHHQSETFVNEHLVLGERMKDIILDIRKIFELVGFAGLRSDVAQYYLKKLSMDDDECFKLANARCRHYKRTNLFKFVHRMEMNELKHSRPRAVQQKIAEKYEAGLYGY